MADMAAFTIKHPTLGELTWKPDKVDQERLERLDAPALGRIENFLKEQSYPLMLRLTAVILSELSSYQRLVKIPSGLDPLDDGWG